MQLCEDSISTKIPSTKLVEPVDSILRNERFINVINESSKPSQARNIFLELNFICRHRIACDIFINAAQDIPSFQNVTVELLNGFKSKKVLHKLDQVQLPSSSKFRDDFEDKAGKPK